MSKIPKKPKQARWKTIVTVVTIAALLVMIYLLRDEISSVIKNLDHVNTWALLLMIPIQFLNYDAYARLYKGFFAILKQKVSYWQMYGVSLELNFVNHVFPSGGVTGVSYFSLRMKSFGISSTKATLAQVLKFALVFVSFQLLLIIGLLSLAIAGQANNLTILFSASIITLVVVGTLAGIYIIESRKRIKNFLTFATRSLNKLIHFVRPHYPETINIGRAQSAFDDLHENYIIIKENWRAMRWPFFYSFMANLTEVLTIYAVFIAFGEYVNFGAVILAYAVANFAGLISVLPGGIGIYEALMTTILATAGVPASISLPVILMYRVLNIILQVPIGYVFYHRAIRGSGFEARS